MASLISDNDIKNLEKIKQTLKEVKEILEQIKEIDNNFSLSNVIEADEETLLILNCNNILLKQVDIDRYEKMLTDKLQHKCVLLQRDIRLDKAIGIDYAKGKDYVTTTYYDAFGNLVKEETVQYK